MENDFPAPLPELTSPGKPSVLLVEDDSGCQALARGLLEGRGYQVTVAVAGEEALRLLDERRFDVVLMDVGLPDLSGLEVTRRLRFREEDTGRYALVIGLTGLAPGEEPCLEAGMDAHLGKPYRPEQLLDLVDAAVSLVPPSLD